VHDSPPIDVVSDEAEFASAAIDARMIAWMLDHGRGMTFELLNDGALAAGPMGVSRGIVVILRGTDVQILPFRLVAGGTREMRYLVGVTVKVRPVDPSWVSAK
jgi:hypothetical protein